jgi:hypothetical protein
VHTISSSPPPSALHCRALLRKARRLSRPTKWRRSSTALLITRNTCPMTGSIKMSNLCRKRESRSSASGNRPGAAGSRGKDFQFAWMERVLDRLHAAGIKAILGPPTYSIPTWLYKVHPEIVVTHNGTAPPLSDPYSPTYLRRKRPDITGRARIMTFLILISGSTRRA